MEILEKVAYMKGLAEGLGLDTKSKEGKLFTIMMDILDDLALELQDLRNDQNDLEDALDAVSGDLSDIETRLYEMEDEEDDMGVYQTICPNCGEEVVFDELSLDGGEITCPACGQKLEFDLEECCGACDPGLDGEDAE